ncbi:MAG: hypothetical protein ACRD16_12295 [Thermoanaerobaculia bacterium]
MKHFLLPAILLEAIFASVALFPDFRPHLLVYLALVSTAVPAAFIFAGRASRRTALACGLIFRATLLVRSPDLSDDLLRYVWDGRVAASGRSPYALAPSDPRLSALRDSGWREMSHRDTRTIYPPVAEFLFKLGAVSGFPQISLKAAFGAADLSVVWLLGAFPGGEFASALYAAFPLSVVESAGMGHVDSVGIALLLASLLLLESGRRGLSGAAAALSVLTKYVSGAALLPGLRRGKLPFLAVLLLVGGLVWRVGEGSGPSPASGLANFATRWEGNSVLYPASFWAVSRIHLPERAKAFYAEWKSRRPQRPWMERIWPYFYAEFFARAALALVLAAGLLVIAVRIADPVRATGASIGLLLLCSPVLHPWYLLWMLPFAALFRSASFLYLAACVPFAYALLDSTPFFTPPVVLLLEYAPFAALLTREILRTPSLFRRDRGWNDGANQRSSG